MMSIDDSVFDFDLNYLESPNTSEHESKFQKQRKAFLSCKKKIIATDSLITKYYDKTEKLKKSELYLMAAKEECKQVCIDRKDIFEKCTLLEKDNQLLKAKNKQLEDDCLLSRNQLDGMKSHAQQLQALIKIHESTIRSLKLESKNEPETKKKGSPCPKEHETLLSHIHLLKDIVYGKKKLKKHHKLLLQKYDKIQHKGDLDGSSNNLFDSLPSSPMFEHDITSGNEYNTNEKVNIYKKAVEDHESDYSNIVSEDTGRGSSSTFYDINSPDYFNNDSPFTIDTNKIKEKKILVNVGTSPSTDYKLVNTATSPVTFNAPENTNDTIIVIEQEEPDLSISDILLSNETVPIKETKKLIDIATSPVRNIAQVHTSTSPVTFDDPDNCTHDTIIVIEQEEPELSTSDIPLSNETVPIKETKKMIDIATSPDRTIAQVHTSTSPVIFEDKRSNINLTENSQDDTNSVNISCKVSKSELCKNNKRKLQIDEIPSQCELEISGRTSSVEKKNCLERNNSINLCSENNDGEIETILSSMRLAYNLISPIPNTPVELRKIIHKNQQPSRSPLAEGSDLAITQQCTECPDVIKLREENKDIHKTLSDITKEIMDIKRILLSQVITPITPQKSIVVNSKTNQDIITESIDIQNDDIHRNANHFSEPMHEETTSPRQFLNQVITSITPQQSAFVSCNEPLQNNSSPGIITDSSDIHNDDVHSNVNQFSKPMNKETSLLRQVTVNNDIQSPQNVNLHMDHQRTVEILPECNNITIVNDEKVAETCDEVSITKASADTRTNDNHVKSPILKSPIVVITIEDVDKCNSLSENESYFLLSDTDKKKNFKSKKLSKLDKFRKKLLPKSKIAKDIEPRRLRFKSKPNSVCKSEQPMDTNALNKKLAYEKAVTIMKEIKLKEKEKYDRKVIIKESKKKKVSNKIYEAKNNELDRSGNVPNKEHKVSDSNEQIVISKDEHSSDQDRDTTNYISTRSRSRKISNRDSISCIDSTNGHEGKGCKVIPRKEIQGDIDNISDSNCTRVLRSTTRRYSDNENLDVNIYKSPELPHKVNRKRKLDEDYNSKYNNDTNDELDLQFEENVPNPKESILCKMIEKFGKVKIKYAAKKVPDNITNSICKKLEDSIADIINLPGDKVNPAMAKLVDDILKDWNLKNFLTGLNKYLKDPARKRELFNKVSAPPAPSMTKSEQVLLYIVKKLQLCVPDIVNNILSHIEFTLFQLNKTPEFDVIESMSHFYAVVCRYFGLKMRLRLFVLDAMYCLSFKVVPLIKQCLDVWMHILPLAHMGIAKSPLVTCLVYLLHFYKCEDKFKRVQEIRFVLYKKYFYKVTDWNESKILEMFKTSIMELSDISDEKKMLRTALIILAKRQGPKWCQKNIVMKMLIPIIDQDVPIKIKHFCVEMLGPLLKPYPVDMKVHCEIVVNSLLDRLDQNPPESLKEAIFTSLIYMSKHNQDRVIQALLYWYPKQVSPEFNHLIRAFVREKPIKVWKGILSRLTA